jgi:hypothetical protein
MKIMRVESLVYGVDDVDAGIHYYEDWDQMDDNWKPRFWEKNPGFAMRMLDKVDAPELSRV